MEENSFKSDGQEIDGDGGNLSDISLQPLDLNDIDFSSISLRPLEENSFKSDGQEIDGDGGDLSNISLRPLDVNEIDFSDISLRPLDLDDIDDVLVWATDDKVGKFSHWGTDTSKEYAMNYIKNVVIPHPWFRAICLKNKPIGTISVTANSGSDKCRGEIGYVVASKYWGKGVATQAVSIVAAAIFWEWPHLERLEALVDVENVGSQRVLEKAGFLREGVLRSYYIFKGRARDMVMFSLLSTDPQARLSW